MEHDALEIWAAQLGVAVEALGRAGLSPADIAGIGITNQRETTVVWDRASGVPVGPAIVWQDRRTATMCERLVAEGHESLFRDRTGLPVDAYFSGTKIAWILDNIPGARARAEAGQLAFGTIDSWLVSRLTDGAAHVPSGGGIPTQSTYVGYASDIQVNPTVSANPSLVRDGTNAIGGSPAGNCASNAVSIALTKA